MKSSPNSEAVPAGLDLDGRIRLAEMRVVDRDQRVLRSAQAIYQRLRQAGEEGAKHRLALGLGGAAIVLIASRLLSRLGISLNNAQAGGPGRAATTGLPRLVALAWPLLPAALRQQLSPRSLALAGSVGLPLLGQLLGHRRHPMATAASVDLRRYSGRWYEIARLPVGSERRCDRNVSADYRYAGRRLHLFNRCEGAAGQVEQVRGIGRVVRGSRGAKLRVSFTPAWLRWLFPLWADYWILFVDPGYRCALVGTPDLRRLWLLSRSPTLDPADYHTLVEQARVRGYDISRLIATPQGLRL